MDALNILLLMARVTRYISGTDKIKCEIMREVDVYGGMRVDVGGCRWMHSVYHY